MKRILGITAMSVGGWVGWELGALVSIFTGFVAGVLGSALGLYLARRWSLRHLP